MTFDFDAGQQTARDKARAFASGSVQPLAAEIDRRSTVPDDLARDAAALVAAADDSLTTVLVIEEVAAASGTVAITAAAGSRALGPSLGLSGLRGAPALENVPRNQLVLAAVALGLGRAALDLALADLRQATASPDTTGEKPHWVVADTATELDAARLLTYKAAVTSAGESAETGIAIARLMASGAAERAINAALRVAGPSGYQDGGLLDRLARDVRAVALLMGTEEQQRATAAAGLLPM